MIQCFGRLRAYISAWFTDTLDNLTRQCVETSGERILFSLKIPIIFSNPFTAYNATRREKICLKTWGAVTVKIELSIPTLSDHSLSTRHKKDHTNERNVQIHVTYVKIAIDWFMPDAYLRKKKKKDKRFLVSCHKRFKVILRETPFNRFSRKRLGSSAQADPSLCFLYSYTDPGVLSHFKSTTTRVGARWTWLSPLQLIQERLKFFLCVFLKHILFNCHSQGQKIGWLNFVFMFVWSIWIESGHWNDRFGSLSRGSNHITWINYYT